MFNKPNKNQVIYIVISTQIISTLLLIAFAKPAIVRILASNDYSENIAPILIAVAIYIAVSIVGYLLMGKIKKS